MTCPVRRPSRSRALDNGSGILRYGWSRIGAHGSAFDAALRFHPQRCTYQRTEVLRTLREGQGAFRVRVLDAYGRRCSVTGERSLPVLDAAHIQEYLGPESNHVQNGLSLRTDIHRLYDEGYVTITPEFRFEVSKRLREEFEN